jgi:hypothetical protein
MAECESIEKCAFFHDKMAKVPASANLMKDNYCKKNFHNCARFMVSKHLGKGSVPSDLYPNETERANKLIWKK